MKLNGFSSNGLKNIGREKPIEDHECESREDKIEQIAFHFKEITQTLKHVKENLNVCLLAVNIGRLFWIKSLFKGTFSNYPAIKFYGKPGEKRKATEKEISRLNRRMKITKGLKGKLNIRN